MHRKSDLLKGSIFLFLMITVWEISAILIKTIFAPNKQAPFKNPLFLTYFSSSFFVLYLIPLALKYCYLHR